LKVCHDSVKDGEKAARQNNGKMLSHDFVVGLLALIDHDSALA
jgi:hypothetical protein